MPSFRCILSSTPVAGAPPRQDVEDDLVQQGALGPQLQPATAGNKLKLCAINAVLTQGPSLPLHAH